MSLSTLIVNNNRGGSGLTPPRFSDVGAWWAADSLQIDGLTSRITDLYDKSGKGNHLGEASSSLLYPYYLKGDGSAGFGGLRVPTFTTDDEYCSSPVDLEDIFGATASLIDQPEFTIAACINMTNDSTATEHFLKLYNNELPGHDKVLLGKGRDGILINMSADSNFSITSTGFTQNTAHTLVVTVGQTVGVDYRLHAWLDGAILHWDDTTFNYYSMPNSPWAIDILQAKISAGWVGNVAEVIVYKGEFTEAEAIEVHEFFETRWDL